MRADGGHRRFENPCFWLALSAPVKLRISDQRPGHPCGASSWRVGPARPRRRLDDLKV